ncbi:MAG TPA: multiheme c-type cytochrome [Gammaproteobacteria bacterium]
MNMDCQRLLILGKVALSVCALSLNVHFAQASPDDTSVYRDSKWLTPHDIKNLEFPFFPSRAIASPPSPQFEAFDSSKVCGGCHIEIYKQWQGSVMAHSWRDPIYRALLKRASEATGGAVDNFCIGCHSPIGMVTNSIVDLDGGDERIPGVDCETCHSIASRTGVDNGAYILHKSINANVKYGPRKDVQSPFHGTAYSELHTRSDFCAVCHNVTHPFNSVAIERTYDEWLDSPYSEQGVQCQDCHMSPETGEDGGMIKSALMGEPHKSIASHYFSGGNAVLLRYFGFDDRAERSIEMLRSAARLELVSSPDVVRSGSIATVTYKISNVGAGHKLPTGFPEGREMWLDFRIHDGNGRQIFRSGAIRGGKTEPGTKNFKVLMGDKDGNIVDINVWEVARVLSDSRIPPMGYATVDYVFHVPHDIQGPLHLNAQLNYWPFSQHMADELLGKGEMEVEVVMMAETEAAIPVEAGYSVVINKEGEGE